MVARARCSGQRCFLAMGVGATARDCAAIGRIGSNSDGITVQFKVGHIVTGRIHGKGISGIRGNCCAAFRPVDEMVARSRCSGQRSFLAMGVGATARDCAAIGRIGSNRNCVGGCIELGYIITFG